MSFIDEGTVATGDRRSRWRIRNVTHVPLGLLASEKTNRSLSQLPVTTIHTIYHVLSMSTQNHPIKQESLRWPNQEGGRIKKGAESRTKHSMSSDLGARYPGWAWVWGVICLVWAYRCHSSCSHKNDKLTEWQITTFPESIVSLKFMI